MELKNVYKAWDIFKIGKCKNEICDQGHGTFNCNLCFN